MVPACGCARRYFTFWLLNFLCHQMAIGLFRLMGAIGRSLVVAYTIAWLIFLLLILLSGFVLSKSKRIAYTAKMCALLILCPGWRGAI